MFDFAVDGIDTWICAFRIVVHNPFFVTSNNFPSKILLC